MITASVRQRWEVFSKYKYTALKKNMDCIDITQVLAPNPRSGTLSTPLALFCTLAYTPDLHNLVPVGGKQKILKLAPE